MNAPRAMGFMAVFAATWAAVEVLAARALTVYSPFQVVFTRYVVHLVVLFALAGRTDPAGLVRTKRLAYQIGRSLLMLGMPACFVFAFRSGVDPRTASAIFWLSPLFIVAFGALVLRERPAPSALAATLAATAGAVLFSGFGPWPGLRLLVLPLGMAGTFSLYVAMTRGLRDEDTRTNLFYTAAGVALALAPFMPRVWVTPTLGDFAVMCGVGSLGLLGLYALDRATHLAPVAVTAPVVCVQLPLNLLLQCVVGRAALRRRDLAGTAVVLAALLFVWLRERRRAVEPARA
ncbi:MAG TPA: DMT family transporter [Polyangiaceae bacterium]|nr:DMT family transporter [Polyangiaceae bacterium]